MTATCERGKMLPVTAIVQQRRLAPRLAWLVPGLALALYAGLLASEHDLGLVPLLAFGRTSPLA